MVRLQGTCPHCNEKSGFNIFAASEFRTKTSIKELDKKQTKEPGFLHPSKRVPARFFVAGTCAQCHMPLLAELEIDDDYLYVLREHIAKPEKLLAEFVPKIIHVWPEPRKPYSHTSIPDRANKLFITAQNTLYRCEDPAVVIATCRSVLENAVRTLDPTADVEEKNLRLYNRIKRLRNRQIISADLENWAVCIKDAGNTAIHELSGTQEEAEEIVEFTKLFLQYTFEFPARIKEIRARHEKKR